MSIENDSGRDCGLNRRRMYSGEIFMKIDKKIESQKIRDIIAALLSSLIKFILQIGFYYPAVIILLLINNDKINYERSRQDLIKKLNQLHLDPYLGLVKPSAKGIIWGGQEISGDNATSLIKKIFIKNFYLKPNYNDVVIDVGAHIGIYSIYASKYANKVIAIEPEARNFDNLVKNISNINNIIPLKIALGDNNETKKLYIHSTLDHSLIFPSDHFLEVPVRKLDDLIIDLKLDKVNLIKLNAEGYEEHILKGAENTLKRFFPNLIIGVHHYEDESEKITDILVKLGYDSQVILIKDGTLQACLKGKNS